MWSCETIMSSFNFAIPSYKETGAINTFIRFNDKTYFSTHIGVFTDEDGLIADDETIGEIGAFIIYNNELYAGGGEGVFVLKGQTWEPVGNKHQLGSILTFGIYQGDLYAGGTLGIAKLNDDIMVSHDHINIISFFETGDEFYVVADTGGSIKKVTLGSIN